MKSAEEKHYIAVRNQEKLRRMGRNGKGRGHQIGDLMPDGSVYAGISPETCRPMYVMPQDEAKEVSFIDEDAYTRDVNKAAMLGHDDWRVPTLRELDILFNDQEKGAFKGTFNTEAGKSYLSSAVCEDNINTLSKRFSDGALDLYDTVCTLPLRLVR